VTQGKKFYVGQSGTLGGGGKSLRQKGAGLPPPVGQRGGGVILSKGKVCAGQGKGSLVKGKDFGLLRQEKGRTILWAHVNKNVARISTSGEGKNRLAGAGGNFS